MKTVTLGAKKKSFNSIKLAADAAKMPYVTLYLRLRNGMPLKQAMTLPVRKYTKKKEKA